MWQFVLIHDITSLQFQQALSLYLQSFSANQRLDIDIITRRTQANQHQVWVGLDSTKHDSQEIVLMAILHPLNHTPFTLLSYLATRPTFQGQGIGTQFLQFIIAQYQQVQKFLILEVETPRTHEDSDSKAQKRIKFYRQLGAVELMEINYLLPPLAEDSPTPMKLLMLPAYPTSTLTGEVVKNLIQLMYQEVYSLSPEDELMTSVLNQIPATVTLK